MLASDYNKIYWKKEGYFRLFALLSTFSLWEIVLKLTVGLVHSFGLLNIFRKSWKYAYVTKSSGLLAQLYVASFKHVVLGLWFCSFGPSQPVMFKHVRETCFSLSLFKKQKQKTTFSFVSR